MTRLPLAAVLLILPGAALAHEAGGMGGFASGALHPLTGLAHLVAMVAVGVWGAILGPPLVVVLPLAFPLMMAAGAILAIAGLPLPAVEVGIALSAVGLGAAVALRWRPPAWAAVAVVAGFALFHGHAHGAALEAGANALAYAAGFVIATGLLHLAGIALGEAAARLPRPAAAHRASGGAIAAVGLAVLAGVA
jgi:urease accessory protein